MSARIKYLPLILAAFVVGLGGTALGLEVLKDLGSCPLGFIGM